MTPNVLLGIWSFVGLFYQGETLPPPNPALKIQYNFTASGVNTLRYFREGEEGFCERKARYEISEGVLFQEVTELNPDNAVWCSQDSDMRLGTKSWASAFIRDKNLYLAVMMGEEELFYIWARQ